MGGIDGAGGRVVFWGRKESIGVGSNFLGDAYLEKRYFGGGWQFRRDVYLEKRVFLGKMAARKKCLSVKRGL